MIQLGEDTISVVICTFERPDACERALKSVLDQTHQPLEILVCDDGSADDTCTRFRGWEQQCQRVRYLRLPHNTGTPASTRNLGTAQAQGAWIAFLDDDDVWLPEKLARQRLAIAGGQVDLIATNAIRSNGAPYFPDAADIMRPTRADLIKGNPIITSSVIVRRSFGGFPTTAWMSGIEDYAAWLRMADGGARFLVLGEALVGYDDLGTERLSAARASRELAVARLAWYRAFRRPHEASKDLAALRRSLGALHVLASDLLTAARARLRRTPAQRL